MKSISRTPQQGFTLIELVVVIVIIGILAAFAIPRFSNISKDARVSSANALLGSIRSTTALVHGLALARQTADGGSIDLEGQTVKILHSYPAVIDAGGGIERALSTTAGYDVVLANPTATFSVKGAPSSGANCKVTYTEPTAAGQAPAIGVDITDC